MSESIANKNWKKKMQTVLSKNSCIGQLHACKLLCMKYFNFGITQVLIYTWINLNNVEIRETVWKKTIY